MKFYFYIKKKEKLENSVKISRIFSISRSIVALTRKLVWQKIKL